MPKRHLEGTTQSDRAKQRQKLGSLRELTVQPATKQRYNRAIDKFLVFLHDNGLRLPNRRDQMDTFACDYLEHLWSTGQGRALASDTIAGLQDQDVRLRGQLPGAWRLLKTWSQHEIPCRAPPLPAHVLHAMVGWAIFHQLFTFAISLLIGFYGMLRTGEIIGLRGSHILSDSRSNTILISLGLTKGGKRHGAAESAVIGYDLAVHFIQHWKTLASPSTPLAVNPGQCRSLFNDSLAALKMSHMNFRPYSLRRGGATWWFSKHHSLDKILLQGRWAAPKTARIYLNEGLSMLAEMVLPPSHPSLAPFLHVFLQHRSRLTISTLEPSVPERAGGRGKKVTKRSMKRSSNKRPGRQKGKSRGKSQWPTTAGRECLVWLILARISSMSCFGFGLATLSLIPDFLPKRLS